MQLHYPTRADSSAAMEVPLHCRRAAAVANLIAHQLFLPSEEKSLLEQACLLHHRGTGLLAPKSMERLLADVLGRDASAVALHDQIPPIVRGVLTAYHIPGTGTPVEARLASILRLADSFDQEMEMQPMDGELIHEILQRLRGGAEAGLWPAEVIDALIYAAGALPDSPPQDWHLPVFPQAALKTLNLLRDPRASLTHVVQAASADPATAGLVMRLANSALYESRIPVSTLAQAIGRLGFATAQRVVTTAALRPVFGSSKLRGIWEHSLQIADLAEQLAARSGMVDPAEAYLAGLVHDVGQLALLSIGLYDSARLEGLLVGGCPRVYAERLILGTDHATLGGDIAAAWRLPNAVVSAIRHHHCPQKALGAFDCLLYLAEYLSGSEEDLPSAIRLEAALKGLGLTLEAAHECTVSSLVAWLAAA